MNKHGLARSIPDSVKRAVRQRCGFGCVRCGSAFYYYDHLEPEFCDALVHDPERIVLLCGDCNRKRTSGLLSKETVAHANATPKAKQLGYSFGEFDFGSNHPAVVLGELRFERTQTIIRAFGRSLLAVAGAEETDGPFRLTAVLADNWGRLIADVEDNEWRGSINNWDIEVEGRRIFLRRGARDLNLRLRLEPPHAIVVEKLDMLYRGCRIVCEEGHRFMVRTSLGTVFTMERVSDAVAQDYAVGVDITATTVAIGGEGGQLSWTDRQDSLVTGYGPGERDDSLARRRPKRR